MASHQARLLLHGGDTMLGRAVQLTFLWQAPNEELIRDSTTAGTYLLMALHRPRDDPDAISMQELREIREENADGSYLWGDYLTALSIFPAPDLRLLNLETAVTASITNADVPHKGIHYHMHSDNLPLAFARFAAATLSENGTSTQEEKDVESPRRPGPYVVSMANNHAMDFGRLAVENETLPALATLPGGAHVVGLGSSIRCAAKAVRVPLLAPKTRHVSCIAVSTVCSGMPPSWRATSTQSGMVVLPALESTTAVQKAVEITAGVLYANNLAWPDRDDLLVLSIHWGPNWAYRQPGDVQKQNFRRQYAHRVVDDLGVDLIYGHSSHHIRGLEIFHGKLIIYGAGDLVNDYEGFANPGDEAFNTLGALFLVDLSERDGSLTQLCLVPTFMHQLQLRRVRQRSYQRWDPARGRMVETDDGVGALCTAINRLSRLDAGTGGQGEAGVPVQLRVEDQWPDVPGGPVLVHSA
ncbi:hypothetical protein BBJ28_00003033 [Nothophytophthora sp. Chile5]|nr:hypothetical protein BBJ28_00003033 [Nothophytophthora sp. Chile5]